MNPTEIQLKYVLKQCGFERRYLSAWIFPDGSYGKIPDVDSLEFLGFLFKYVVPKHIYLDISIHNTAHLYDVQLKVWGAKEVWETEHYYDKDPAIALLEAIYKALGGI